MTGEPKELSATTPSSHDALVEKMARAIEPDLWEFEADDARIHKHDLFASPRIQASLGRARAALAVALAHYSDPAKVSDRMCGASHVAHEEASGVRTVLWGDRRAIAAAMKATLTES
jgi:hypothetical protein